MHMGRSWCIKQFTLTHVNFLYWGRFSKGCLHTSLSSWSHHTRERKTRPQDRSSAHREEWGVTDFLWHARAQFGVWVYRLHITDAGFSMWIHRLRVHNSTAVGLKISQRMTTISQQEALVSWAARCVQLSEMRNIKYNMAETENKTKYALITSTMAGWMLQNGLYIFDQRILYR